MSNRQYYYEPPPDSLRSVMSQYGKYLALFVGAGLISGSVVHFPLDRPRYALIGAVGAGMFAIASLIADGAGKSPAALTRLAASSLALALGIGMISGSIQHFQDIPDRAASLIPLGLILSVFAFIVRHDKRISMTSAMRATPAAAALIFALSFGLNQAAAGTTAPAAGHGHGAAEGSAGHEEAPEAPHGSAGTAPTHSGAETAPARSEAEPVSSHPEVDGAPALPDAVAAEDQDSNAYAAVVVPAEAPADEHVSADEPAVPRQKAAAAPPKKAVAAPEQVLADDGHAHMHAD